MTLEDVILSEWTLGSLIVVSIIAMVCAMALHEPIRTVEHNGHLFVITDSSAFHSPECKCHKEVLK